MAHLEFQGLEELLEALHKAGDVPDATKQKMLTSMGAAVETQITNSAGSHGVPSGPMLASVYSKKPKVTADGGSVVTTFKGGRHRFNTYTREAEIAFITNYGKKGEPARPFISDVIDKPDDSIAQAGEAALNEWLSKNGL